MQQNDRNNLNPLPPLAADLSDREQLPAAARNPRAARHAGGGLLWLLLLLQSAALAAGGVWGWQEMSRADRQLADAQHNFARINEQLAERIQTIDGKLVSTESTVESGSENLRQQISALGKRLDELQASLQNTVQTALKESQQKQQDSQKALSARQQTLEKQLEQLASTSKAQVDGLAELGKQLAAQGKQLSTQAAQLSAQSGQLDTQRQQIAAQIDVLATQKNTQKELLVSLQKMQQVQTELYEKLPQGDEQSAELRKLREQFGGVSSMATTLSSLQKQVQQSAGAISRLEREQLALKVGQENRAGGSSPAEFDAFRAQLTRSISSLQAQIQKLQQKNP